MTDFSVMTTTERTVARARFGPNHKSASAKEAEL
jgi:hypothetical protein